MLIPTLFPSEPTTMDHDLSNLMKAVTERQLAVTQLQEKYASSENAPTEQLVHDLRDLQASERAVFDAIITMFVGLVQATPAPVALPEFS
jgi:hypothetical protein